MTESSKMLALITFGANNNEVVRGGSDKTINLFRPNYKIIKIQLTLYSGL